MRICFNRQSQCQLRHWEWWLKYKYPDSFLLNLFDRKTHSRSLQHIDYKSFSGEINPDLKYRNFIVDISDHLLSFIIILEKYLFTFLNNSWFFLLLFWIITLCWERICVDTKPFQLIISKFDSITIFKQVWLLKAEHLNWIGFVSKYSVRVFFLPPKSTENLIYS